MTKKAVLISIRPKWCELIVNGKKTVEVRKTRKQKHSAWSLVLTITSRTI